MSKWQQLGLAIGRRVHHGPVKPRVRKPRPRKTILIRTLFDQTHYDDPLDDPIDDLFRVSEERS